MWMNELEIAMASRAQHECPNVRRGIRLLYRLMEAVNRQSDGWPYWHAPAKAADRLMELLQTAGRLEYGTRGRITEAQLRKAITPIKAMVTRQKRIQAKYGNTFEFDVAEALKE